MKEEIVREKAKNKNQTKKKYFFAGLFEKLDKEMEKKAKSQPCCCKPSDKEKNSCCS